MTLHWNWQTYLAFVLRLLLAACARGVPLLPPQPLLGSGSELGSSAGSSSSSARQWSCPERFCQHPVVPFNANQTQIGQTYSSSRFGDCN